MHKNNKGKTMTIYFTADTHLGHANIIKYCKRPFSSTREMDEIIYCNWAAVVRPQDCVYHLGDVAWGDAHLGCGQFQFLTQTKQASLRESLIRILHTIILQMT